MRTGSTVSSTVEHEVIVIGLGGIGSAAAYWLARRTGGDTLGLERFRFGHERGASQDHSRIIRRSYHTPLYVRMADAAYRTWEQVEREAGKELVVRTGGLDLWPAGATIPMNDYTSSLRACGVPFEELDTAEIMRRWPQWRLSGDVRGLFQEDGGLVVVGAANAAHRRMAAEHGATLLDSIPVNSIDDRGEEVRVHTDDRVFNCRTAVVAGDAWTNDLLRPLGVHLPLTVTQEQVVYFDPREPDAFAPERFPVWIWMDDPSFYGLPAFGPAGPKAGQDVGGQEVSAETRTFETDPSALRRVRSFVDERIPSLGGTTIAVKPCLYTLTPDRDFVIDRVTGHPNVLVALGAAHGFKFASLIGLILSELALDGRSSVDLGPFRIDRPALTTPRPARRFLV
jgi:sarcosine oxidase